ncbi:MAG TPA: hypothetical protein DHW45_05365 [Candidatus Latescibacteria bacterium]|nr:hypothetical protein [Candidatus Latescibacterota bacterium]
MGFCGGNNFLEPLTVWIPTVPPFGLDYYRPDRIEEWTRKLPFTFLSGAARYPLPSRPTGCRPEKRRSCSEMSLSHVETDVLA